LMRLIAPSSPACEIRKSLMLQYRLDLQSDFFVDVSAVDCRHER
jgi:hypothetical protein